MKFNVSFLGLGVMGYPMAGYLARAGHNVTVYNRSTDKAEKWVKKIRRPVGANTRCCCSRL